jgi:hypothetical protein
LFSAFFGKCTTEEKNNNYPNKHRPETQHLRADASRCWVSLRIEQAKMDFYFAQMTYENYGLDEGTEVPN